MILNWRSQAIRIVQFIFIFNAVTRGVSRFNAPLPKKNLFWRLFSLTIVLLEKKIVIDGPPLLEFFFQLTNWIRFNIVRDSNRYWVSYLLVTNLDYGFNVCKFIQKQIVWTWPWNLDLNRCVWLPTCMLITEFHLKKYWIDEEKIINPLPISRDGSKYSNLYPNFESNRKSINLFEQFGNFIIISLLVLLKIKLDISIW